MNFTDNTTLSRISRKVNWQLFSLAAGLALALSAGAFAAGFPGEGLSSSAASTQPAAQLSSRPAFGDYALPRAEAGRSIIYIVGTEAEGVALRQQFHEVSSGHGDKTQRATLVVDAPEMQEMVNILLLEQMSTGAFDVLDLR